MNQALKNIPHHSILCLFLLCLSLFCINLNAQILNEDYAAGADVLILKNEIDIFASIQQGVKLSVAECELFEACDANVNRDELNQLISTIGTRINSLSVRYSDTGDTSLEDVLVGYVDIRDAFNVILGKINELPQFVYQQPVVQDFGAEDFFGFGATNYNEVSDDIQKLFEDVDEVIDDDNFSDDETP